AGAGMVSPGRKNVASPGRELLSPGRGSRGGSREAGGGGGDGGGWSDHESEGCDEAGEMHGGVLMPACVHMLLARVAQEHNAHAARIVFSYHHHSSTSTGPLTHSPCSPLFLSSCPSPPPSLPNTAPREHRAPTPARPRRSVSQTSLSSDGPLVRSASTPSAAASTAAVPTAASASATASPAAACTPCVTTASSMRHRMRDYDQSRIDRLRDGVPVARDSPQGGMPLVRDSSLPLPLVRDSSLPARLSHHQPTQQQQQQQGAGGIHQVPAPIPEDEEVLPLRSRRSSKSPSHTSSHLSPHLSSHLTAQAGATPHHPRSAVPSAKASPAQSSSKGSPALPSASSSRLSYSTPPSPARFGLVPPSPTHSLVSSTFARIPASPGRDLFGGSAFSKERKVDQGAEGVGKLSKVPEDPGEKAGGEKVKDLKHKWRFPSMLLRVGGGNRSRPLSSGSAQCRVLQRFVFTYSSPQSTPLPTGLSLSAPPSDESVEPSGPYPELVGCLISNCEAEIYAGAMVAQELRWLTYLLTDLGEAPRSPPVLYVDNKAMLAL
ncbi:unnamed protein product, partial [Closterium sp. NIES-53]